LSLHILREHSRNQQRAISRSVNEIGRARPFATGSDENESGRSRKREREREREKPNQLRAKTGINAF
jgi:hypothetical protein